MEMRSALRVRLEQSTQRQRLCGLSGLQIQALGDATMVSWMDHATRATKSEADAVPTPPAGVDARAQSSFWHAIDSCS
eukprot:6633926-Pyramimonas_sp.AAC.1